MLLSCGPNPTEQDLLIARDCCPFVHLAVSEDTDRECCVLQVDHTLVD